MYKTWENKKLIFNATNCIDKSLWPKCLEYYQILGVKYAICNLHDALQCNVVQCSASRSLCVCEVTLHIFHPLESAWDQAPYSQAPCANLILEIFDIIDKCFCPYCKIYLSELHNIIVKIVKSICPNCNMYLSKLQVVKCQQWKLNLFELRKIFV